MPVSVLSDLRRAVSVLSDLRRAVCLCQFLVSYAGLCQFSVILSRPIGRHRGCGFNKLCSLINVDFWLWISVTKLLARVPVSITAAVLATMIKKAAVPRTFTAESAVHSPPHNSGP